MKQEYIQDMIALHGNWFYFNDMLGAIQNYLHFHLWDKVS